MSNILYLVHRLPYPPNKGDKVRSYHLLQHLRKQHNVFLGTFVDDPDDARHVETLRGQCTELFVRRLHPLWARLRSANALISRDPLTLRYYRDAAMFDWVEATCQRNRIDSIVVFSSSMLQYTEALGRIPMVIDFVDVDSEKWTQYAQTRPWPASWLYRREGELLLGYERTMAARASRAFFVTDPETDLFRRRAPEVAVRVDTMGNGVDTAYFSAETEWPSPYGDTGPVVAFTGAMDYWPNIDAVTWFAAECLPALLVRHPKLRFAIVGRSPAPEVLRLASDRILVTGTVPDVRPYLKHASAIVAPLRVARGIQNKVLEAMAMACPVVTSDTCGAVLHGKSGEEFLSAADAPGYVDALDRILGSSSLASTLGQKARECVLRHYGWEAHLAVIDQYLPRIRTGGSGA